MLVQRWHTTSVPNYCQSVSPKQTTLEEDRELFQNFSSILCLWFEIQGSRTDNFFGWVLNTDTTIGITLCQRWPNASVPTLGRCWHNVGVQPLGQRWANWQIHVGPTLVSPRWSNVRVDVGATLGQRRNASWVVIIKSPFDVIPRDKPLDSGCFLQQRKLGLLTNNGFHNKKTETLLRISCVK